MDPHDPNCQARNRAVPSSLELYLSQSDQAGPLHEDVDSPLPGLELIRRALERAYGNVSKAAKILGIPRQTLQYKIINLGLGAS